MARNNDLAGKEQAFLAAARRFPQSELAIRRLMGVSEDFCDLCGELAEAEQALARVPQFAAQKREERQREWQELVDCLVVEIGEVLAEHGRVKPDPGNPD
ncbi:hypothetical protein [Sinorhizobium meliloti]|uniref:hypothetical protein n=1 Tax=Rhizobium meliloti TaxID=382 RepID=UPI0018F50FF5|nr:hypothetical protein [Sinorhizobium meliloti]